MVFGWGSRIGTGLALLTCGVSGVLALAGCGSGGPGSSLAATTSGAPSSSSTAHPSATASALPSWASALGGSVTVVPPHPASPGHGSPGAAVGGFVAAINSKHYADSCAYVQPSAQAGCRSQVSGAAAGQMPYDTNFALGYVVIGGNRAVVGMTGTFCAPGQSPECFTNDDPAAVFSTAKSFSALWANATTPSSGYSLNPCVEIDGKWYFYSSSS
jgi:hypothetical protein